MAKGKYKYHYFYKITNNINNHFYYGIHSTNNIEDGYMGSGSRLHHAYKKYGMENFTKEILKYFDTREELAQYEADVVTEELVLDENCYNISCGGEKWNTLNSISVIDKDGNRFRCKANDPKWLNGEYHTSTTGKAVIINDNGEKILVSKEDKIKYNLHGIRYHKTLVFDENNNKIFIDTADPRFLSGEYKSIFKGKVPVKDKYGKFYVISKDDPRYLNGELVHNLLGFHHTVETKQKMHETHLMNQHQQGEKNSQYGTCWIHNDKESIKIKKEQLEEYISNGWIKGRKMKF